MKHLVIVVSVYLGFVQEYNYFLSHKGKLDCIKNWEIEAKSRIA